MSVQLTTVDGEIEDGMANGTWRALTAAAAAYCEGVDPWNGCHDPQYYSAEQLRTIATRARQCAEFADLLDEMAAHGGARLS